MSNPLRQVICRELQELLRAALKTAAWVMAAYIIKELVVGAVK